MDWKASIAQWKLTAVGLPMEPTEPDDADDQGLTPRQLFLESMLESAVESFGPFNQGMGPDGSCYMESIDNHMGKMGCVCSGCEFFDAGECEIVSGAIDPGGCCKFFLGQTAGGDMNNMANM